jgi:quercetin dioxygenase-like cupin family protein
MSMNEGFLFRPFSDLTLLSFLGSTIRPLIQPDDEIENSSYFIQMPPSGFVERSYHKIAKEVIFVISGYGTAFLGNSILSLKKGDTMIIFPPTPHGFKAGDSGLEMISFLSSQVNSKRDFYSCSKEAIEDPIVLGGEWVEKSQQQ